MSGDNGLVSLLTIIGRLEIMTRERDDELYHAREIIQRLQDREAVRSSKGSVLTAPPLSERVTPPGKAAPITAERNRDRKPNLVRGYDFQIGDWVEINYPREGQPHEGEIIGRTRHRLIEIKGVVRVDKRDTDIIMR